MNRIKESIDEALQDFEVTDELKTRTIKKIEQTTSFRKSGPSFRFAMRGMTLVASFMILLVLSLSYVFGGQSPESEEIKNYRININIIPNRIHSGFFSKPTEEFEATQQKEQVEYEDEDEDKVDSHDSDERK